MQLSVYKAKLFSEALELERDVLEFGYDVERYYDDIFDAIASDDDLFKAPIDTSTDGAWTHLPQELKPMTGKATRTVEALGSSTSCSLELEST